MLDFTIFPANALYVKESLEVCSHILASSPTHVGHLQMPFVQKQTSLSVVIKHRRAIEDQLLKAKVSIKDEVSLLFTRPDEATASDRRSLAQKCIAVNFEEFRNNAFPQCLACDSDFVLV